MRIAIWTGNYQYWQSVHPDNLIKTDATQMGGSETAALSIAQELGRQGHQVLLGCKTSYPESFGNLRICPLNLFGTVIFAEKYDTLVSWDDTLIFRFALPHIPVKVVCYQLNDTTLGVMEHVIDRYFHPSKWHAERFRTLYNVPEDKQRVGLTNGTDPQLFIEFPTRQKNVVYASSPDRGLHHLLRMWPQVLAAVPDAHLHIYYDMDKWLGIVSAVLARQQEVPTADRALEVRNRLIGLENATYHGGVSRVEVTSAMLRARVMAYPCDPIAPTEGFSMTTLEAWVAGCNVVLSDADALQELWGARDGVTCLPLPVTDDIWIDQIVKGLQEEALDGPRLLPSELSWSSIARRWVEEFKQLCTSH